jgi:hypothetical protein
MKKLALGGMFAGMVGMAVIVGACSKIDDGTDAPAAQAPEEVSGPFFGRVFDAVTGDPIAGAGARFVAGGSSDAAPGEAEVRSDEDGLFELLRPKAGFMQLRVLAEGYAELRFPTYSELHSECEIPWRAHPVRLSRPATLEGKVLDEEGQGLDGISVTVSRSSLSDSGGSDVTEGGGRYRIEGLSPEVRLFVRFSRDGPAGRLDVIEDVVCLRPEQTHRLDIHLRGRAAVEGRLITSEGQALSGREILLSPTLSIDGRTPLSGNVKKWACGRTDTDDEGRFRFGGVRPGRWWIAASDEKGHPTWSLRQIEVRPGEDRVRVDLLGTASPGVIGSVVDDQGVPVRGAAVFLCRGREARVVGAITDWKGLFRFLDVAGKGLRLIAFSFDLRDFPDCVITHHGSLSVVVDAGDRCDFRLEAGGSLVCGLLDATTGERTEGTVLLNRAGSSELSTWLDRDELQGLVTVESEFEFRGLRPGSYDVTGYRADGAVGTQRVEVLAGALVKSVIRLEEGAWLHLVHGGPRGVIRAHTFVDGFYLSGSSLVRNEGKWIPVPAGHLEAHFHDEEGKRHTQECQLSAGERGEALFVGEAR